MKNYITVNRKTTSDASEFHVTLSGDAADAIMAWAAATHGICTAYEIDLRSLMSKGVDVVEHYKDAYHNSALYDYTALQAMEQRGCD